MKERNSTPLLMSRGVNTLGSVFSKEMLFTNVLSYPTTQSFYALELVLVSRVLQLVLGSLLWNAASLGLGTSVGSSNLASCKNLPTE